MANATLVDLLRARAEERGEQRAYRFLRDGESLEDTRTWAGIDRRARAIGTTLRAMGATGTNVLMLFAPGIEFIDGYFGCLYAGAVPVPAYPPDPTRLGRTLPRVQAIVADARARFALTTKALLAIADFVFAQAPDLRRLEWLATDTVEDAAGDAWGRPSITGDTFAMMQYTSGSTGIPKGVMLTHTNLIANADMVFRAFEFNADDRILTWLPVFHDMGFMSGVLQPLYAGVPVVGLPPPSFLEKPYRWLAAIHASRATVSGGPNFAFDLCVRKTTPEQRAALDLSCWKLAYNGAETVRRDTLDRFAQTFSVSGFDRRAMFPCYGLAEATLIVSGSDRAAEPATVTIDKLALEDGKIEPSKDGAVQISCGRPAHDTTIIIVDPETSTRVDAGRVGEIWMRSPSVGKGYWQRPEDSQATFTAPLVGDDDRWLRTGDLGFLHDGELYICGRAKDLIIIRGANHYPQDIELTVERAHGAIRPGCVAAFAVQSADEEKVVVVAEVDRRYHGRDRRRLDRGSDRRDEDPAAQRAPGVDPLDVDQLFWVVRDAIAERHEIEPEAIVLIRAGSIQKTSSGKLQRRACKAALAANELEVLAEWKSDGTKRLSDVASTRRRSTTPSSQPPVNAPAAVPAAETTKPPSPAPEQARPTVPIDALRRPSVLVVEADLEHRDFVTLALTHSHVAVVAPDSSADGNAALIEKAIQQLGVTTFAAIVSDDLAILAKIAEQSPTSVRLLATAFDDPEAVRDALTSGRVTGVISKKAGPQQVLAAVVEAVDDWVGHHTDLAIKAIESWLASFLASRLSLNAQAIDLDASVTSYGLDSLNIVEAQTALGDWLGHAVPETLIRGKASIRSIARRLASASHPGERVTREIPTLRDDGIAIVGMGCTVPGARDIASLWQLIASNGDAVSEAPADRQLTATRGGFVDGIADFDAAFFGIAPRDAAQIDPQHRLLLETTWQALEDAGVAPSDLAGSDTGVFIGVSGSDFLRKHPELSISDAPSAAAQRLSYFFNLRGPSFAIDAGDASSLAALHLAVSSLQRNECKVAIVGGINLVLSPLTHDAYAKARLLASDGVTRPLDARGEGSVLSDGCGVIVLKRAADARSGGNRIHAQILATAVAQNGRGHGLTAPNEAAQELVIREAVTRANVQANEVCYAELNARAIPAVDAIEVRALAAVIGSDRIAERPCAVGSLKANLGDTRAASGILGVIKTALVVEHGQVPKLGHLDQLHHDIALGDGLVAPSLAQPWPKHGKSDARRVATVHNFGLLGTNGVAVLASDSPPPAHMTATHAQTTAGQELPGYALCLSARSEAALRTLADRYAHALDATPADRLADTCFTANSGRAHFAQRAAIIASTPADMRDRLRGIADGSIKTQRTVGRGAARIAFLFTGRGVAAPEMARQLFAVEPRFRSVLQRSDRVIRDLLNRPLLTSLYPMGPSSPAWDPILDDPATVAVEYALADLWQAWGVYPDVVMGHDIGEYAAAAVAGAMGLEDAVALACERTRRVRDIRQPVAAASVLGSEAEIAAAITALGDAVSIVEHNGPRMFDVVGPPAAIHALVTKLANDGIRSTSRRDPSPLHTALVEPMLEGFAAAASRLQLRAPSIPLISNVSGRPHAGPLDAAYWRQHTRSAVHFDRGVRELIREGSDVFIEIGPRSMLAPSSAELVGSWPGLWLASLDPDATGDWEHMLLALGALYERGITPNWKGFYHGQERRRVALPSYPFERRRCWPA